MPIVEKSIKNIYCLIALLRSKERLHMSKKKVNEANYYLLVLGVIYDLIK